jgi:hypothetical protein
MVAHRNQTMVIARRVRQGRMIPARIWQGTVMTPMVQEQTVLARRDQKMMIAQRVWHGRMIPWGFWQGMVITPMVQEQLVLATHMDLLTP